MKWKLVEYPKAGPAPPSSIEELNEIRAKYKESLAKIKAAEENSNQ